MRYRLLDTIRQYAEEQLQAAGEAAALRDRHLDHFLALAEEAQPGLDSDQDHWRELLESHHDNLNAALHWGLSAPAGRAERGRRLAAAMARQWCCGDPAAEGWRWRGCAGTGIQRGHGVDPHDRWSPCLRHIRPGRCRIPSIQANPHYAEALPPVRRLRRETLSPSRALTWELAAVLG